MHEVHCTCYEINITNGGTGIKLLLSDVITVLLSSLKLTF